MTHHRCAPARWLAVTVGGILVLILLQGSTHAATATPYFTNLVSQLQARSTALTGTKDKIAKTQKKAIDTALKSITAAHGLTVADDLKLVSTIAKGLAVPFKSEFVQGGAPILPGTQAFGGLFSTLASNLAGEVTADLDEIDTQISTLTNAKTKAALAKTAAATRVKLNAALGQTSVATLASALATIQTGILSLAKTVLKAVNSGGGGGGGGNSMTATVTGQPNFSTSGILKMFMEFGGKWVISIGGVEIGVPSHAITIYVNNVTGHGTYPLDSGGSHYYAGTNSWNSNVSGTVTFSTLDTTAQTAAGTFTFTADEWGNVANHLTATGSFTVVK